MSKIEKIITCVTNDKIDLQARGIINCYFNLVRIEFVTEICNESKFDEIALFLEPVTLTYPYSLMYYNGITSKHTLTINPKFFSLDERFLGFLSCKHAPSIVIRSKFNFEIRLVFELYPATETDERKETYINQYNIINVTPNFDKAFTTIGIYPDAYYGIGFFIEPDVSSNFPEIIKFKINEIQFFDYDLFTYQYIGDVINPKLFDAQYDDKKNILSNFMTENIVDKIISNICYDENKICWIPLSLHRKWDSNDWLDPQKTTGIHFPKFDHANLLISGKFNGNVYALSVNTMLTQIGRTGFLALTT